MIEADPKDVELALVRAELRTLREQNERLRAGAGARVGVLPPEEEAPQETRCRHGKDLVNGRGCLEPCKNKRCGHPCSAHAANCLETVGLDDRKRPVTCSCVGLSY